MTREDIDDLIDELSIPKDNEDYYLDAFGHRVSFNNIRTLKSSFTKLNLTTKHIEEIYKCSSDYVYFRENYCMIMTKKGYDRPEPRGYQSRFEQDLLNYNRNAVLFSRQSGKCCDGDTLIKVHNKETDEISDITMEEFHNLLDVLDVLDDMIINDSSNKLSINNNSSNKLSDSVERKFVEQKSTSMYEVLTDTGWEEITKSNKTIEYLTYEITFDNGTKLKCADNHILIDKNYNEIFAKDSENVYILSDGGLTKVVNVVNLGYKKNMYDLSVNSSNHTYYTNGILSHNTVTVATYLIWKALFSYDKVIGIAANKHSMAVEVLDKIKNIFINLPIWLMSGVTSWNKQSIAFDNGTRILTAATNGDSFRGFSLDLVFVDECAFIRSTLWEEFADSVFPSVTAKDDSQIILCSTPKGMNHFYSIIKGSKEGTELEDNNGFNSTSNVGVNGYKLSDMAWDEVPGRDDNWRSEQIAENGLVYFNQNFGLDFAGSSDTLLSSHLLQRMTSKEPEYLGKWIDELRIYELPEDNKKYIISVDPAKDGIDKIAIQVIDVTKIPFVQVAVTNTDMSYLKLAPELVELAKAYNTAFIVIENNEGSGQSLNDIIHNTYDYENLFKDPKGADGKIKRYYGFRTTSKTRKLILSIGKVFLENDRLIINDSKTIDEFFHFSNIGGKYQAEDGYHDDLVMSLFLMFAPIIEIKNFEDQKKFINSIFSKQDDEDMEFDEMFSFGNFNRGLSETNDSSYTNRFDAENFNMNDFYNRDSSQVDELSPFG